ncbi:hypothetical protein V6N11_033410 [Hibiscus sabdariffa]|uniref:Thioredoxin domain-containing protein n=1 Tax=Hibiscus sabdariffa TaxID=183260 RepID=A0ABR2PXZ9_9ROSI
MAALSSPTLRFGTSVSRPAMMISQPVVSLSSRGRFLGFTGLKIRSYSTVSFAPSHSRCPRVSKHPGCVVCEAQETALDILAVTDETWQSLVLKADGPVLVEFWAPWCGPCRMIDPVIGELAQEYAGRLKCFKLNTDDSPSVATQYGIRSIPTIMIFVNGGLVPSLDYQKAKTASGFGPKVFIRSIITYLSFRCIILGAKRDRLPSPTTRLEVDDWSPIRNKTTCFVDIVYNIGFPGTYLVDITPIRTQPEIVESVTRFRARQENEHDLEESSKAKAAGLLTASSTEVRDLEQSRALQQGPSPSLEGRLTSRGKFWFYWLPPGFVPLTFMKMQVVFNVTHSFGYIDLYLTLLPSRVGMNKIICKNKFYDMKI